MENNNLQLENLLPENYSEMSRDQKEDALRNMYINLLPDENKDLKDNPYYTAHLNMIINNIILAPTLDLEPIVWTEEDEKEFGKLPKCEMYYPKFKTNLSNNE